MSSPNRVTVRDLLEETKKRVLFLVICIVGLSYMMSLTSSSVWVNLPAAAVTIILIRYFSLDLEMRRKAATYIRRPLPENGISQEKPLECPKVVKKSEWRRKVNSRVAEDAIDHFTRHLISEWVTDLWYSRLTPDKEGPEELINIVNSVLGEIAGRFRNINLIDLLMRDLINLICTHLENFRSTKGKIEKRQLGTITIEQLDTELRRLLAMENRLHPALFSSEAQHKVLQHVMDGLILLTFKREDLQCLYFRYTARELLASAVMRPVLNLASPRFINERIESLVINMKKPKKVESLPENLGSKRDGSSSVSSEDVSKFLDPSMAGVELVQMKNVQPTTPAVLPAKCNSNASFSKDPLLSIDTRSSRSWNSVPLTAQNVDGSTPQKHSSSEEWGEKLDQFSRRKVKALAPEHFENMWAKGRNYKTKEDENQLNKNVQQGLLHGKPVSVSVNREKRIDRENVGKLNCSKNNTVHLGCTDQLTVNGLSCRTDSNILNDSSMMHYQDNDRDVMHLNDLDSNGNTSEDEETSDVTGLDSPGTKVWNARNNRNVGISHIHHPLESSDGSRVKKAGGKGKDHNHSLSRNQSGRKRSRHNSEKLPVWQEVERTSFISGDGQDILNSPLGPINEEDYSDDSDMESSVRIHSGAAASSSVPSISHILPSDYSQSSQMVDSFFRLKCEVMGANIVKSGSRTFAVYSISVTDVNNNNSWSIKRRFSHFEELHRRLKEFSEYNLHLPPKHFLSTGLDVPVIQERCNLLDKYLKRLIQLPKISGSIEVWDFLSVDSQTYIFLNSFSIIETLSVDLADKPHEDNRRSVSTPNSPMSGLLPLRRDHAFAESLEPKLQAKSKFQANGLRLNTKDATMEKSGLSDRSSGKTEIQKENGTLSNRNNSGKTESQKEKEKSGEASDLLLDAATDPTLPTEWVPPNLTVPIFDLVDVIFQLQDGGWIRRKAFWVAKQVLQLGMGDALEDWLIQKIQRFRKGSSMASAITRLEQILWPGGVFISKRPKQRPSPPEGSTSGNNPNEILSPRSLEELQQQQANHRAKFVYDLMITNAPPAIVGLVGRKEYEQCAKDLYYFLQSAVCMKLLALDLIELLLLTLFPELDYVFKQLHERKEKFGELDLHE